MRDFIDKKASAVNRFERNYLLQAIYRNRGNVSRSASQAGMLRSAFQRLMRKHDLSHVASDMRKELR